MIIEKMYRFLDFSLEICFYNIQNQLKILGSPKLVLIWVMIILGFKTV